MKTHRTARKTTKAPTPEAKLKKPRVLPGDTTWPSIRWVKLRDKEGGKYSKWRVDARTAEGGARKLFDTREEADGWREAQRTKRKNEGLGGFEERRLAKYGWTVAKAIDFTLRHLDRQAKSKPLRMAFLALLDFKRGKVDDSRLKDIELKLARFVNLYPDEAVASIEPKRINEFLDQFTDVVTRNGFRKEIVMLWRFAYAHKWVEAPLNSFNVPRLDEPKKAAEILTVAHAKNLMNASTDPEIRAMNALILFGGVRREEAEKLTWEDIDFETGHVMVSTSAAKTNEERHSPICDNLRSWLEPIKGTGQIVNRSNIDRRIRAVFKAANLTPWTQDAHRHSFISYRRQLVGDAQTALEAGTSERIIKTHYKKPVTQEQALKYFNIRPDAQEEEDIIPMTPAA